MQGAAELFSDREGRQLGSFDKPGCQHRLEVHLLKAMEFFQACQDFRYLKEDIGSEV